ncbi:MAG: hypothetical protein AAAC47_13880 [Pararhizobium sp.]
MSDYVLGFLILTAGVALGWALRKQRREPKGPAGLTLAKRSFGAWIVLVVAGGVAFAIWFILAMLGYVSMLNDMASQ